MSYRAKARCSMDIPDAHIIAELHKESRRTEVKEYAVIVPDSSYEKYDCELPEEDNVIIIEL